MQPVNTFAWILSGGLLMSAIALVGSLTTVLKPAALERLWLPLVALAAGTLLGGALFHLIPEGMAVLGPLQGAVWILAGFMTFLALEQFLHWPAHEVPQELGDFGVLVHGGWTRRRALLWNLASWLTFLVGALLAGSASAQGPERQVHVYLFWQQGCPHCERQIRYVAGIEARDSATRVYYLELGRVENRRVYAEAARALGMRELAVPLTVVGDTALVGATADISAGPTVEELIAQCRRSACADVLGPVAQELSATSDRALAIIEIGGEPEESPLGTGEPRAQVRLPWFGEVDLRALSLPALTVVLAAVDGFNPCAMWVLVFLISLLLGLQNRARRWLLGGAFLVTTALVYYAVIAAWLSVLMVIGGLRWLRVGIGVIALAGGVYYVWEYVRNPEALCQVAGDSRRQKIMAGLRAATGEPRFLVALAAIVALAVGVNFIELVCSAGIPAVYTQVLALTPMPIWQHYSWLALYVMVFLLDDLAIFVVAMVTLEITGITTRYAHHAQLVGGVVLTAVGVLLILRPQWLSFG